MEWSNLPIDWENLQVANESAIVSKRESLLPFRRSVTEVTLTSIGYQNPTPMIATDRFVGSNKKNKIKLWKLSNVIGLAHVYVVQMLISSSKLCRGINWLILLNDVVSGIDWFACCFGQFVYLLNYRVQRLNILELHGDGRNRHWYGNGRRRCFACK